MATRDVEGSLRPIQSAMLEKLCQALRRAGHGRGLIQLVETWGSLGKLPSSVALLEAGVLLEMRLVDRAWVRLQECESDLGETLEHALLYTELFLQRGWPARARRHAEKALEIHPEQRDLLALLRSADDPASDVPSDARDVELGGTPEEKLELAERYLCSGSHLKARSVLERLRANNGYWSERVEDLIWAIEGNFAQDDEDVMALAESLLPLVAGLDTGQGGVDGSTQTRVGPILVDMDDPPVALADGAAFPALFRWLEEETQDEGATAEITAVSHMAELGENGFEELDDEDQTGSNQTRIMHVIHRDEGDFGDTTAGSIILESAELSDMERPEESDLDLSESVEEPFLDEEFEIDDVDFEHDALLLEAEDADRVVVTRMEAETTNTEPGTDVQPIEVVPQKLEQVSKSPVVKKQVVQETSTDRPEGWRDEVTKELVAPSSLLREIAEPIREAERASAPLGVRMVTSDEPEGVIGRNLFGLALLVILLGGFGLLVGNRMLSVRSARAVVGEAYSVLNQSDYQELLRSEARLELELSEGRGPLGSRYAAMALVDLTLWGDFSGGRRRLEMATDSIRAGKRFSDGTESLVLAEAWRFFYLGEHSKARAVLSSGIQEMPEVVFLKSRIAYEEKRFSEALELAEQVVSQMPESIRNQLWMAQVCTASSELDCARSALDKARMIDSDHPELELIEIRIDSVGLTPVERVERLSIYLRENQDLAPRRAGSVEYEMAALYVQLGDQSRAKEAVERVLARDPENPFARYLSGVLRFEENRLKEAFSDFEACLESRPSDLRCAAGRIYVVLDQDRVVRAREHVKELQKTGASAEALSLLNARVGWAEEKDDEELLELLAGLEPDPEVAILQGEIHAKTGSRAEAEADFLRAVEGLLASNDPLHRRLLGRAYANLALLDIEAVYDEYASKALQYAPIDPVVRVLVGQRLERAGFRKHAAEQLDLAVNLGPETALVHYARGAFYMDFGDKHERTLTSWHRYRQLKPSGPRARRVESRLQALQ